MRFETLKTIASRLVDADLVGDSLSVVWHAGEPLVLSPEWYSEAIKILAEILPKPVSVEHHFQTNGLLIDDAWCDFFKRAGARVGVSIDGPQDLHDASRRTRGGKGTHAQVVRGIRQLQLAGVPLHAICVVTKAHLDHPDRLYHFFVELGIKELGFNIEEIDGINKNSTLNGDEAAAAFARFFSRIMFNYRQNPDLICIREVERVLVSLMNSAPTKLSGSVQTRPLAIVSVAWNGDISTFSPELLGISDPRLGPMSFGNVATHSFADVLADTRLQQIAVEISRGVKRCRKACPYFGFCRGGAPANKLGETGRLDTTVTMFCKLTHMVITEAVLSGLEQDLDNQARAVHPNRMRDGASGGLDTFAD